MAVFSEEPYGCDGKGAAVFGKSAGTFSEKRQGFFPCAAGEGRGSGGGAGQSLSSLRLR